MDSENITFIREVHQSALALIESTSTTITPLAGFVLQAKQEATIKLRLLALLAKAEAMGEKALWGWRHSDCYKNDAGKWFCRGPTSDASHEKTDADYIRAVRERWGI